MLKKGWFITFEGPDGSGKTTVSKAVYDRLKSAGYDAIYTREPGGSDIAEQIREIILRPENTRMDARTEALLYAASRRQHLVEKVIPALQAGRIVICDRFVDSSLVYQGIARQIGVDEVFAINRFAIDKYMPDMTLYLDIDAAEGLRRINRNRVNKDRLDCEDLAFHQAVEAGYRQIIAKFQDRYNVIDARKDVETLVTEAYRLIVDRVDGDV